MKQGRLREILEDLSLNRAETNQERIKRIDTAIKEIFALLPKENFSIVERSGQRYASIKDDGYNAACKDHRKALGL